MNKALLAIVLISCIFMQQYSCAQPSILKAFNQLDAQVKVDPFVNADQTTVLYLKMFLTKSELAIEEMPEEETDIRPSRDLNPGPLAPKARIIATRPHGHFKGILINPVLISGDKINIGPLNIIENIHQQMSQDSVLKTTIESQQVKKVQSDNVPISLNNSALNESLGAMSMNDLEQRDQSIFPTAEYYQNLRKTSQAESELAIEEMPEEETDIRRKINQKLIRNKNYFMNFIGEGNGTQNSHSNHIFSKDDYSQTANKMIQLYDKRSRSETPDKMSATEVLLRAHKKLAAQAEKRKQSPHKILEKHQQRQKKAEELRSLIEQSKKNWYEKIRIRQQIARKKWQELLAERKAKLQDKLEQAEERRESELQSLINKAKQEIQKIDETNYIVKMTMNNMKLDLNLKMNETQERRNQYMEEQIKRKQADRALKEEAAEKRRQELQKSTENKFLTNKQKREQADLRRNMMIEQKKRAAQEKQKRILVLQRKNDLGDKLSDVMSFVNNSECIWEFLGNERDWQDLGDYYSTRDEDFIFELIQKDHFEIQKLKLKKDAEILNKIIVINDKGEIYSNKEYIALAKKNIQRQGKSEFDLSDEESMQDDSQSEASEDKASIPEEALRDEDCVKDDEDIKDQDVLMNNNQSEIFNNELQTYHMHTLRLKMSMKRNVLKKNLSEDLTWADFLKNESYTYQQNPYPQIKLGQTRSMRSTPERRQEIPSESENNQTISSGNQTQEAEIIQNQNSKKKKKHQQQNQTLNNQQNTQNTSSGSNLSEKSRISSVVYPSKNKKNPKNQSGTSINNPNQEQIKALMNMKRSSGSNQSSTQSLSINTGDNSLNLGKKIPSLDTESARKRSSRMHSSSVQESSGTNIQNLNQNNNANQSMMEENNTAYEKIAEYQYMTHTGSQMSSLITNPKPVPPQSKVLPKKLTLNANKMLFPINPQKLLIKRPGKEGQFGKFKIIVKMEDLSTSKTLINTSINMSSSHILTESSVDEKLPLQKSFIQTLAAQPLESEIKKDSPLGKKSLQNTPSDNKRKESLDESNQLQINTSSLNNSVSMEQTSATGTPQTSRLLQIQQKFWEKYQNQNQTLEEQASTSNLSKKYQAVIQQQQLNSTIQSDSSQSPPKREKMQISTSIESDQQSNSTNTTSILQLNYMSNPSPNEIGNVQMNEQGYKELMIKYILTDNIHLLKTEDNQKTVAVEGQDADKVIDYLEINELNIKYCRLCDLIIPDHMSIEAHTQLKSHKKTRDELGIKEVEDLQFSIISMNSQPGDIEKELLKEKEKALKRKVKRIKTQMISQAVSHESAAYNPGKEYNSPNKKRLQILCIDLEKQVIPIINNYEALENTLKEIIKILDLRKQPDLHLMRKLKYIPILIEICKRISVCHKNEFKYLGKMLDYVIKIINIFCGLRENRNYMLQTNRMLALIELLNWCLNRPTQLFYGIIFMPTLFHILTLHVKHRAPYECQQMKEMFVEYLICSQITIKIKSKFQIINGPLDLSEMMGQVPLFLLKSAAFIESLTNILQIDAINRPVYEKSTKIGEHIIFVIQNTELFGIIPMITTILLSRNQPFKPSQNYQQIVSTSNKILPQTILSLAITSVKILNNVLRMDYKAAQQMMSDFEIQEQLYHLFNYLLYYTIETIDQQEDSKELLHETLLLIGYFTLNHEKHQQILCKGENTLIQKLCNLPFTYFCDKKLKEILFPTLIQVSYKNDRCLAIMDQEIAIKMLVDFINMNLKEELPKIEEEINDYHSISSLGGHQINGGLVDRRTRSPSQSSTSSQCSMQIDIINGNCPYLPLYMRFPKKLWKDAIQFYSQVL
ncbi:UNKNOWN [Stylonychia lemnae]|uniref:Uncharacterized protein n=1 Tax=Stylonychia lemnae TaxID=5949 RepID=A0A078B8N6_STYLE|nr:UNKNOWN [Stylonychia lemnae]|eukprot:CDW90779.1 UNKNOWN [Stylonychia lemnae]